LAASQLASQGLDVLVLEKLTFPRFVIGESLLPQSMMFLEKAGVVPRLEGASFQHKNGAAFLRGSTTSVIDFAEKSSAGWATTYQVKRAEFDQHLAEFAAQSGAEVRYGQTVTAVDLSGDETCLSVKDEASGAEREVRCRFLLDASGYGRVLPQLLDLERPSDFPVRAALFTHVRDNLAGKAFDREKILITVHPENQDIWYWLIPFSDGTASVGVVIRPELLAAYQLWALIGEGGDLADLLCDAEALRPVGQLTGYSTDVTQLCSDRFALLGNAGEFLDPVFSSGVTIALKSADLVVEPVVRQLRGEVVDWQKDYAEPLSKGVRCFKHFVQSWYQGDLQKIIFNPPEGDNPIKSMIISILAGYAWDDANPFVAKGEDYLKMVAAQCD
jgi:flavin-dependent dehydrogenase